jgi:hypothetical protein
MASRFFFARAFLREHAARYSAVLLVDSRDVIIQRDPFEGLHHGLLVGLENKLLAEEQNNWSWLVSLYGADAALLAHLAMQRIICAGVTLGTTQAVLRYLDMLCNEVMQQLPQMVYMDYYDQAIHNKILYGEHDLEIRWNDNTSGWVAHLATSSLDEFDPDLSQGLRTKEGRIVNIVHQYDRHPALSSALLRRLTTA